MITGRGSEPRWGKRCCICTYRSGYLSWKASLSCCWPFNYTRRPMDNCTECQIEARGPGWPCSHLSTPQPFRFHWPGDSPWKDHPRDASFNHQPLPSCHREAGITIGIEEIRGWYHLSHPHLLWIADLKAIGVQCQQPHQCQTVGQVRMLLAFPTCQLM